MAADQLKLSVGLDVPTATEMSSRMSAMTEHTSLTMTRKRLLRHRSRHRPAAALMAAQRVRQWSGAGRVADRREWVEN